MKVSITVEGGPKSGKSTVAQAIIEMLSRQGVDASLLDENKEHTIYTRGRFMIPGSATTTLNSTFEVAV